MKSIVLAGALLAMVNTSAAQAQQTVQWQAPASGLTGQYAFFPMGTALQLTTRTELTTKDNHAGDRFYLEVAEPLMYHGQVVVPVGSVAVGEVMRADRNGHFGKKGHLEVRLTYLQTPSGPVRLSGRLARQGRDQGLLSIGGAVVLLGWGPLLIHGTSGKLPAETPMTAYLADDLHFAVQADAVHSAVAVGPDTMSQPVQGVPARFETSANAIDRR